MKTTYPLVTLFCAALVAAGPVPGRFQARTNHLVEPVATISHVAAPPAQSHVAAVPSHVATPPAAGKSS